jgi:hypothetical protein
LRYVQLFENWSNHKPNPIISEGLQYHLENNLCIAESVYRPGSKAHIELLAEAKELWITGWMQVDQITEDLFETTDLGEVGLYNGEIVPLDLPLEEFKINEAEYKGRKVELNVPKRGGEGKKYQVYVMNPKTNQVMKINFGDVSGGLTAKVSDPKARKSFAARHRCHLKNDKTKAGYWACRINRYAHLWGGKTYPGFW